MLLAALCVTLAVPLTEASFGLPIVHCSSEQSPAKFHWQIPPWASARTVVVVSLQGEEIFTWIKGMVSLREYSYSDRLEMMHTETENISFSLARVSGGDAGDYVCREGSVQGSLIPECGQSLLYIDAKQPHIYHNVLAVLGARSDLNCIVDVPNYELDLGLKFSFQWFKDGRHLPGQKGRVLTFHEAKKSDEGRYTCRVTEDTRRCVTSPESPYYSVIVLQSPRVSLRPRGNTAPLHVAQGQRLTLTCVIEAAVPPVPWTGYQWSFSPPDSSPPRQLHVTGDTLTLGPMTRKDSGQYTCQAWNNEDFEDLLGPGSDSVYVSVSYLENMFLTPDVEVGEGETITLTCTVESSPTAHLQWLVEGVLRRNVTANADNYVVTKAAGRDGGKYTCRASIGDFLRVQASTVVTVKGLARSEDTLSTVGFPLNVIAVTAVHGLTERASNGGGDFHSERSCQANGSGIPGAQLKVVLLALSAVTLTFTK